MEWWTQQIQKKAIVTVCDVVAKVATQFQNWRFFNNSFLNPIPIYTRVNDKQPHAIGQRLLTFLWSSLPTNNCYDYQFNSDVTITSHINISWSPLCVISIPGARGCCGIVTDCLGWPGLLSVQPHAPWWLAVRPLPLSYHWVCMECQYKEVWHWARVSQSGISVCMSLLVSRDPRWTVSQESS